MINKKDKILGLVYAFTKERRYDLVRDLGVQWIRFNIPFPWTEKMFGAPSARWLTVKESLRPAVDAGLKVMPSIPCLGHWGFDAEKGVTRWHEDWPEFVGEKGTPQFYDNVRATAKFMCEDLGSLAGGLWQCMNEIDITMFRGDYSEEVAAAACRATAEGIKQANPQALCGHNFAGWDDTKHHLGDRLYTNNTPFDYCGVDHYFGSMQEGSVESWPRVINEIYERWHLPVLINEWGYVSNARTCTEAERPAPSDIPEGWMDNCVVNGLFYEAPGGHTPEVAAEYFRRGLEIFAKHPHVLGNFLFAFADAPTCWHCGRPECPAECYWGIVDKNLNPKPAYYAIQKAIAEYYRV